MDIERVRRQRHGTPAVVIGDLTLIRPLAMCGVQTVAVVTDPADITLLSRRVAGHLVVPTLSGPDERVTLARLVELSRELRWFDGPRPPLFYGSDDSLDFVRRHRAALEAHYVFLLNDALVAETLLDKGRFTRMAVDAGVAAPASLDESELADRLHELRPPLLIKPKRKLAWKPLQKALFEGYGKARVFADAHELMRDEKFLAHKGELVVQEYIHTDNVLSFHTFVDNDGHELASFCGRKVRAFPLVTGESACIELIHDDRLLEFGRDVVRRLGLKGPCKLDVIADADRDGSLMLLEANARFNLWHYLGAVHGINLLKVAYDYLLGHVVDCADEYRPSTRWCSLYRDYRAFRSLHRLREMTLAEWIVELVSEPKVYEAFAWDDPVPATRWLLQQVSQQVGQQVKRWHATA
jgi:predicted ATP-grasp superfamily ATP-dependent carboligase